MKKPTYCKKKPETQNLGKKNPQKPKTTDKRKGFILTKKKRKKKMHNVKI